ncbi:pseudouridine synthase [Lipomyces kononenkoae]|uniref:Pseudouridine synthase n=1 Tax=Lipomyces kononenkoae TaxID=34357 RepID=A0ACC3T9X8_LIPKO
MTDTLSSSDALALNHPRFSSSPSSCRRSPLSSPSLPTLLLLRTMTSSPATRDGLRRHQQKRSRTTTTTTTTTVTTTTTTTTALARPGRRRKEPPPKPSSEVEQDDDATLDAPPHKRARAQDTCKADQSTCLLTEKPAVGITEADVGITQYLGQSATFSGVLKLRYTDFCVNEITTSGEVLHVQHVPVIAPPLLPQSMEEETREEGDFDIDEIVEQQIAELLGDECIESLREIAKSGGSYETKKLDGKDDRAKVHQIIRAAYNSKINSKTTRECTLRFSKLTGNASRNRKGHGRRNKASKTLDPMVVNNMGSREAFIHFTVFKEREVDACNIIAKLLSMKPKCITIADANDRRGVTVQRASIAHTPVKRLISLNKDFHGMVLSDFRYEKEQIKLGDLRGNEFLITIRDVKLPATDAKDIETVVNEALTSLAKTGFINYFGMQRFGTHSVPTHDIGIKLLQERYQEAAQLLLSVRPLVLPESVAAREQYARDPNDISSALKLMPQCCTAEVNLLRGLEKFRSNWLVAIQQIPVNLRVMYVQAYQSFVWNTVVSERIAKFGLSVLEGDLVLDDAKKVPTRDAGDDVEEDVMDRSDSATARPITPEEISEGKFNIFDVVMPLPGVDVEYPAHPDLRASYERIMAKERLTPYKMRHKAKEFSLSGAYRHVLVLPGNVEWWYRRYSDPLQQMIRTDLDTLRAREETGVEPSRVLCQEEIPAGDRLAVILNLRMGPSQYATMALREVMKIETHVE